MIAASTSLILYCHHKYYEKYVTAFITVTPVHRPVRVTMSHQLIRLPRWQGRFHSFTPLTRLCYVGTFALSRDNRL